MDPESAGAMEDYPQSWNAYAYVGNNPLNVTDPDGEKWKVCDNQGNCVEISDAEAKRTLFNRKGNHPEIIRKDGKIFDEEGNVAGTYTRLSFDDLSDRANALIFGPNSIGEQGIKKGKFVGKLALAAGAVGIVCGVTAGAGCAAAAGTAIRQAVTRAAPSFLRQLAGKDKKILELAFNNAKGGSGSFASNLEAVSKATSQIIPGGKVSVIGSINGATVFGSARSGVGIAEIGGKTMVVKKVGESFKVLGEFLGK